MPWQHRVADVALEIDPNTGLLYYRRVGLLVPRQQGKTELELGVAVHRAQAWARQVISYAAQTRIKAREKWQESHVATLDRSPFGPPGNRYTVSLANGNEAIHWRNGSRHGITAATETSGHGDVLDLGFIDEAWAQIDPRLEQAMQPAMLTRSKASNPDAHGAQLWDVSTAGNHRSIYLRAKVDQGRALVEGGGPIRICYFEWSAPPDANPYDETTWWGCLPALGYTMDTDDVRALLDSMDLAEFRRAVLNQWPDEQPQGWDVVSRQHWNACADEDSRIQETAGLALAADINPERSYGALAVAGLPTGSLTPLSGDEAGSLTAVEVIEHRAGTAWMVPRIIDIMRTWKPRIVVIDPAGPAGSLLPELSRELASTVPEVGEHGIKLVTTREAAQAAQGLYDAAVNRAVIHRNQAPLNLALAGAQKRPIGDAWLWARKNLAVDICPLVAATLARFGYLIAPEPEQAYDPLDSIR
jgi:hypothetical protein